MVGPEGTIKELCRKYCRMQGAEEGAAAGSGAARRSSVSALRMTRTAMVPQAGIIPRALLDTLLRMGGAFNTTTCALSVTFVEILNDEVYDLLCGTGGIAVPPNPDDAE
jgi:hypothetical protein